MEDIRIPFILWFGDETPPDLRAEAAPIAIRVSFHVEGKTEQQDATDPHEGMTAATGGKANV